MDDLSFNSYNSSHSQLSTSSTSSTTSTQQQELEPDQDNHRLRRDARSSPLIDFHSEHGVSRSAISELAAALDQLHIESLSPEKGSKNPSTTAHDNTCGAPFRCPSGSSPRPVEKMASFSKGCSLDANEAAGIGAANTVAGGQNVVAQNNEHHLGSKFQHSDPPPESDEVKAVLRAQVSRLLEGQYSLLLSIPDTEDSDGTTAEAREANPYPAGCDSSTERKRRVFGCNVVTSRHRPFSGQGHACPKLAANIITVVATPLPEHQETLPKVCEDASMDLVIPGRLKVATPTKERLPPHNKSPESQNTPVGIFSLASSQPASLSPIIASPNSDYSVNSRCSGSRRASSEFHHSPRIEDVLEFIDQEADYVEEFVKEFTGALGAASHSANISRPDESQPTRTLKLHIPTMQCTASSRTSPTSARLQPAVNPFKATTTTTTAAVKQANRRSIAVMPLLPKHSDVGQRAGANERSESPGEKHSDSQKIKAIPRPLSLQPPRPLTKSTKAPTVPSFELPGKAVARRLKEQREARLAQQCSPKKPTTTTSRHQPKPTRLTTQPGSNIREEDTLRRKEEREARLRQEEKERPRIREPKMESVRVARSAEISRSQHTIASRARRFDVGSENSPIRPEPPASKRTSHQPLTVAVVSNISAQSGRGRGTAISTKMQGARATSTSTGAGGSGPDSFSADELQPQEMHAKKISKRESLYFGDQERIKRTREQVAKGAREEAAERSRNLGREWAEKQQRKLAAIKMKPASAPAGV